MDAHWSSGYWRPLCSFASLFFRYFQSFFQQSPLVIFAVFTKKMSTSKKLFRIFSSHFLAISTVYQRLPSVLTFFFGKPSRSPVVGKSIYFHYICLCFCLSGSLPFCLTVSLYLSLFLSLSKISLECFALVLLPQN